VYFEVYFGEIACDVVLVVFNFTEYVEQKNAHIFMKILMIEEEL
jgi:hypothetical protein